MAVTKKETKALIARLKRVVEEISSDRDDLRNIIDEAETLIDSIDRAEEGLDSAIDALSEYA